MTFGERVYGEVPYAEAGAARVISVTVPLAVAVATSLTPVPEGDTYTVTLGPALAVAQGWTPAASQQAIIAVPLARAVAAGLTPILAGVSLVVPLARSKAVGLSPTWAQVITGGTDATNAMDGRSRGGLATGSVTRPVAPVPAGLTRGQRYDKVMAYPAPTMVDGRPT